MSLKSLGYKVFNRKNCKTFHYNDDLLHSETIIDIESKESFERLIRIQQDKDVIFLSESELRSLYEEL